MTSVLSRRGGDIKDVHTQRDGQGRSSEKAAICNLRKRAFWPLNLGLLASRIVRKLISII